MKRTIVNVVGMAVVAAGQFKPGSDTAWACLTCQPGWLEVHNLAVEEERHQLQLEECVARMDFDSAVERREKVAHPGGTLTLASPEYTEDLALRVTAAGGKG